MERSDEKKYIKKELFALSQMYDCYLIKFRNKVKGKKWKQRGIKHDCGALLLQKKATN